MDKEKLYTKIEDKLEDNICDLLKKETMNPSELDMLGKAVDILKDISKMEVDESTIQAMEWFEDDEDGYSPMSGARRGRRSGATHIRYDGSVSGERGRSPITGRYVSRDSYPMWDTSGRMMPRPHEFYEHSGANHGGMYDGRRSGHGVNDRLIKAMEREYDIAETEHDRATIDEVLAFIRRMGV